MSSITLRADLVTRDHDRIHEEESSCYSNLNNKGIEIHDYQINPKGLSNKKWIKKVEDD